MEMSFKQIDAFWSKVAKTDTCWLWTKSLSDDGYGRTSVNGKGYGAHRLAYALEVGPIPDRMLVDHRCHVRHCVNPAHLRLATPKQNAENLKGVTHWNETGIRGVTWARGHGKYTAQVRHNGKLYCLGYFTDKHEAERVVVAKRNELFTHNDLDRVQG